MKTNREYTPCGKETSNFTHWVNNKLHERTIELQQLVKFHEKLMRSKHPVSSQPESADDSDDDDTDDDYL